MKKGKLLEITLRIIQESLKDKDDTEIFQNFELTNISGRKREFDIVLKANLNGFSFTTVIECKDYKKPVAVEKIEAFHSKCLRIPQINKKIFVARNGFQADAINSAKDFGIELYSIEEIDNKLINNWLSISMIKPVERVLFFKQISIFPNPKIENTEFSLQSPIFYKKELGSSSIGEFLYEIITQSEVCRNPIYFTREGEKVDRNDDYVLEIESIDDLYLKDSNDKRYDITKIYVAFSIIAKEVKGKVNIEKLKSDSGKELSTVITHDTEGSENIKLVLKDSNPNKFDPFIIDKRSGEIFDLGYTFEYVKKDENK